MQQVFCVALVAGSYPGKETHLRESMTKKTLYFTHLLLSKDSQDVYLDPFDQLHSLFPLVFTSQHPLEE